jgi:uncharacterized C2H2 Zn-finger protein
MTMVKCNHCREEFESDDELSGHIEREHSTSPDAGAVGKRISCPRCGAELSSQDNLDVHLHDAHAA